MKRSVFRLHKFGALLVALAVVSAAEGMARLVETKLGSLAWGNRDFSIRFDQLEAINAGGETVDVVFLGSSMMATALDPGQFIADSCCYDAAYNASIRAMSGRTLELWSKEVVIPLTNPGIAVIGLSSRAVNDSGTNQENLDTLYQTSDGRKHWIGGDSRLDSIERALTGWSALVRSRSVLREPATAVAAIARPEVIGELGDEKRPWRERSFQVTPGFRENIETRVLNEYSIGMIDSAAIERTIQWLLEQGIRVYIVDMPVTSELIEMHPRGSRDFAAYRNWLRATVENTGAVLLSVPDMPWDYEVFADPDHLNAAGTTRFTKWLAQELSERSTQVSLDR